MTTDLVRIFAVSSTETSTPGLRQYAIHATKVAQPSTSLSLQTVNSYAASLCQRAKDLNRAIAVTYKRTAYGETLVRAHFLKTEAA